MLNTYDDIFIGHPGSLSAQKLDILWEPAGGGVRILRGTSGGHAAGNH